MRLFFAIDPPEDVRMLLQELREDLTGVRWIPESNLHLTLRFIGEADEGRQRDIVDAAASVRADSVSVRLVGAGTFPSLRRPSVLWACVENARGVQHLQSRLSDSLGELGLRREDRPFSPHVTLARVRHGLRSEIRAWIAAHEAFSTDTFSAVSFELYSSELRPEGAAYRKLQSYPLD